MKLLVVIAAVLIHLAFADEAVDPINTYHQQCLDESKVDPAIPQKIRDGVFENDAKLKKYLFCFQKKGGFVSESGDFLKEPLEKALLAGVGQETAKNILDKCLAKKGSAEETSFEYFKCTHRLRATTPPASS